MISDVAKNTIKIFHPSQDLDEAVDEVVLVWLDGRLSKIEERYYHSGISTYPYHRHEKGKILESSEMDIGRVLKAIEQAQSF